MRRMTAEADRKHAEQLEMRDVNAITLNDACVKYLRANVANGGAE